MGKSKSKAPKDPFREGKRAIGEGVEDFLDRDFENFDTLRPGQRVAFAQDAFGRPLTGGARTAIRTGGFTPLNSNQLGAISTFRGLQGGDAAFNSALRAFGNDQGLDILRGIDVGNRQRQAESALRGIDFSGLLGSNTGRNLRSLDINAQRSAALGDLRLEDPNARFLRQTGSGAFLGPDSNPFLRQSVEAAQRPVLDAFTRQVQPQLAAQFGGGFGVGGSASINAQRLAAGELTRNLSDSATQAFAANFEAERQRQEAANQFLAQLQLQRGQSLADTRLGFTGQELGRRTSLDNLLAQQAQARVQGQLSRGQSLAQSGLGFTNARLQRGTNIQQLQNQRASGIANVAAQRGQQRLAAAQGLLQGGTLQQQNDLLAADIAARQFNTQRNRDLVQLQLAAPLITGGAPQAAVPGRNTLAGGIGGALSGAATGAAIGSAVPGIGTGLGALGGGLLGGVAGIL